MGVLGIVVSVGTFLIGYRQTIGAKKERVANANLEIERILVRRVVMEKYHPVISDLARLIDGKARDFRVRPEDLISEDQLLNTLYTRIVETELIPSEQRNSLLEIVLKAIGESEKFPDSIAREDIINSDLTASRSSRLIMVVFAALATMLGGFVSALPAITLDSGIFEAFRNVLPSVIATIVISLSTITALYSASRYRAKQEEPTNRSDTQISRMKFENEINRILQMVGKVTVGKPTDPFDFIVDQGGRITIIKAKAWPNKVPISLIAQTLYRLESAMKERGALQALLVLKEQPTPAMLARYAGKPVRLIGVNDLNKYLKPK
jgi:hypothetical protein